MIKIQAKVKEIEVVNFLLNQALCTLDNNPRIKKYYKLSDSDLMEAENFRKRMVNSLLEIKEPTK